MNGHEKQFLLANWLFHLVRFTDRNDADPDHRSNDRAQVSVFAHLIAII
jgi:hypothetical protein